MTDFMKRIWSVVSLDSQEEHAFSCFSSKKILSSIGKKDAIKKNDKYFEKIKNVVKTTDFLRSIDYTDDTVKDKKSRKGE